MREIVSLCCVLFVLICALELVYTQVTPEIPSIACPNNFEYLSYNNEYIARITVPNVGQGATQLDVQLTQRESVPSNFYGRLSLYQDHQSTLNYINNGVPVSYRLDFPLPNVLPKLLRISLNGNVICASMDQPWDIVFNLQHMLQTPVQLNAVTTATTTTPPPIVFKDEIITSITPLPTPTITSTPSSNPPHTEINSAPQSQNLNTQCGVASVKQPMTDTSMIVSGETISRGEHPWLVAIYKNESEGMKFLCVGSLVSARSIISASSIFMLQSITAPDVVVYLGGYNIEDDEESGAVIRNVTRLFLHPDYDIHSFSDADLAILKMATPISFTEYIRPICLWKETAENPIIGQLGNIVTWEFDKQLSNINGLSILKAGVIVSNEVCLNASMTYDLFVSARTICAGNRNSSGPCLADAGAGLMFNRDGVWMLRGVVSAGHAELGNCDVDGYVVYCDLAKHLKWVQSHIF